MTNKSKIINEVNLRQDAGWAGKSQMHLKYVHYFGGESSNAILKARGIIKDNQEDTRLLSKPKECPNCGESNTPDSKFCQKCKMVLKYEGVEEILEAEKKKDQEILGLKDQILNMQQYLKSYDEKVNSYHEKVVEVIKSQKREHGERMKRLLKENQWYVNKYGISEPFKKRLEELKEQMDALPPEADE